MKVINGVRISVTSEITNLSVGGAPEGDIEKTEERADGFLHYTDGNIMLSYKTATDNGEIDTDIIFDGGCVRVMRKGAIGCDFVFAEGEEHASLYSVGAYSFDTKVKARRIRSDMTERGGCIRIFYDMHIGGADKYVKMKIIAE